MAIERRTQRPCELRPGQRNRLDWLITLDEPSLRDGDACAWNLVDEAKPVSHLRSG
jgi:hypothetical protein